MTELERVINIARHQCDVSTALGKKLKIALDALGVIGINKGCIDPAKTAQEAVADLNKINYPTPISPKADPS